MFFFLNGLTLFAGHKYYDLGTQDHKVVIMAVTSALIIAPILGAVGITYQKQRRISLPRVEVKEFRER